MLSVTLVLLCVLATATAAPDGFWMEPRSENKIQSHIPHLKLPAFVPRNTISCSRKLVKTKLAPGESVTFQNPNFPVPRNTISCSRKLVKTKLAPGESVTFQSPNFPDNYDSMVLCKWKFSSSTNIIITCDTFRLQKPNKNGKCLDKLTIDGTQFCGSSLSSYSGDKSLNVRFKSNKKKNNEGFVCTATAESDTSVTTPPGTCKCGQANRASRIVNGFETEVMEYPWQAAMVFSWSTSVFCGGSVIGSKHILTAAHCTQAVTDYGVSYRVLVGAHSLNSAASSQQILDAKRFIQHARYDRTNFDNDIAIIELKSSIDFTSTIIRPVCLPSSASNDYDNVTATVSGWGHLEFQGSSSTVLMEVDVPTMSNTKCLSYHGGGITDNMICAGYEEGGKDSCQNDSGGPLITLEGWSYTQIGVVSWGNGCASPNSPGVYARVTKYLSWISRKSASSTTCPAA